VFPDEGRKAALDSGMLSLSADLISSCESINVLQSVMDVVSTLVDHGE
jgi:hypothetical protein